MTWRTIGYYSNTTSCGTDTEVVTNKRSWILGGIFWWIRICDHVDDYFVAQLHALCWLVQSQLIPVPLQSHWCSEGQGESEVRLTTYLGRVLLVDTAVTIVAVTIILEASTANTRGTTVALMLWGPGRIRSAINDILAKILACCHSCRTCRSRNYSWGKYIQCPRGHMRYGRV